MIPASMRQALALAEGDAVMLELDGDRLSLTPYAASVRRAQDILRDAKPNGPGRSLSDELIADRREAAGRGE